MGACGSSDAAVDSPDMRKNNTRIEKLLREHGKTLEAQSKLLLLGPGESGKSTVFKQVKILQPNGGFTESELLHFAAVCVSNVLSQMRILIHNAERLGNKLSEECQKHAQHVLDLPEGGDYLDDFTGKALKELWADKGIQKTFKKAGSEFQLNDSTAYFFNKIDDMCDENFLPSQDDVLRARVRSTGIEEAHFFFEDGDFRMFDVGGQRSERRKWIHCFDCVTAVLFVASVSEYDQVLREDETQNRMKETILLFDEIVNSPWFSNTPFILFLNKIDLLREKVEKKVSFSDYFPQYDGKLEFDPVLDFIKEMFLEQKQSKGETYCHPTCAIDTKQMTSVIMAVRSILTKSTLNEAGLYD